MPVELYFLLSSTVRLLATTGVSLASLIPSASSLLQSKCSLSLRDKDLGLLGVCREAVVTRSTAGHPGDGELGACRARGHRERASQACVSSLSPLGLGTVRHPD